MSRYRGSFARKIGKIRPNVNNLNFDAASARHNYDIEIDENGNPKTQVKKPVPA